MNLNRRSFFGVAVASPFAAKEAAQKVIEQAAQMDAGGISYYSDSLYTGISASSDEGPMRSLWDAIKDIGMPDWKRDDLREDARRSRTLDPDIAAMKSFSLSAKMRMQWDRNYRTLVDRAMEQTRMERIKRSFFEAHPDISEY
ncbi:MAG: hypothetical protein AB7F96_22590 [Beijerinckiaceae bacterium]